MSELKTSGTILMIFPTQRINDKMQKREFVIETQEQYPQQIKFELVNDKCSYLDSHKVGDKVEVHFNLRGREWNGKYFVNLNAWRINNETTAEASAPVETHKAQFVPPASSDDLPF